MQENHKIMINHENREQDNGAEGAPSPCNLFAQRTFYR